MQTHSWTAAPWRPRRRVLCRVLLTSSPAALSGSRVAGPHGRLHATRAAQQEPQDWEAPGEGAAPQAAGSERCADDALLSRARQRGGLLLHPSRHEDAHLTLCPVAAPAAALPGSAKRGGSKTAAAGASKRQARQLAAKQQRDAKRAEVVQAKRSSCVTPKVRAKRGRAHSEARQQASTSSTVRSRPAPSPVARPAVKTQVRQYT